MFKQLRMIQLLDRLARALRLPSIAQWQYHDADYQIAAVGDNALRSAIAEAAATGKMQDRHRTIEMEAQHPGYTQELNRQRALLGLPIL